MFKGKLIQAGWWRKWLWMSLMNRQAGKFGWCVQNNWSLSAANLHTCLMANVLSLQLLTVMGQCRSAKSSKAEKEPGWRSRRNELLNWNLEMPRMGCSWEHFPLITSGSWPLWVGAELHCRPLGIYCIPLDVGLETLQTPVLYSEVETLLSGRWGTKALRTSTFLGKVGVSGEG